jgi:hypothetical protein
MAMTLLRCAFHDRQGQQCGIIVYKRLCMIMSFYSKLSVMVGTVYDCFPRQERSPLE